MRSVLEIVLAVLAVDFVSGLVHWAEDTFGRETTPVLGRWIVAPNVRHHLEPAAFVEQGWLASSWDLALAAVVLVALALAGGWLTPGVFVFALLGANANQLHKWCHAPARAPRSVRLAWRVGLLQGPRHHGLHHRGAMNRAYCVVTPWLNPVLDRIGFWRALERVLVPLTGAPRRADLRSIRRIGRRRAA
jgi:ubiquitin-conjugating enzyme E2 variant